MSTIDVTIACSGSSPEETVAALEYIAPASANAASAP